MKTGWKLDRVLRIRLWLLGLGSLLGMMFGALADVGAAEPLTSPPQSMAEWLGDVLITLLLAPLTVTFCGPGAFSGLPDPYRLLLLPGGLLFWPIYALLVWRWMKTEAAWLLVLIVLWCVQGFFMPLHRLNMLLYMTMSV